MTSVKENSDTKLEISKQYERNIVFCYTCRRIVGCSFPIEHCHRHLGSLSLIMQGDYGFGYFKDTDENRKFLEEHYPPRDKIVIDI